METLHWCETQNVNTPWSLTSQDRVNKDYCLFHGVAFKCNFYTKDDPEIWRSAIVLMKARQVCRSVAQEEEVRKGARREKGRSQRRVIKKGKQRFRIPKGQVLLPPYLIASPDLCLSFRFSLFKVQVSSYFLWHVFVLRISFDNTINHYVNMNDLQARITQNT